MKHTRDALTLILATIVLFLVLIQPNHPGAMTWGALIVFPLELPAILLALVALGRSRAGIVFRAVLVTSLIVIATLKVADLVSFNALSRGFNPVADLFLVDAFVRLLSGTIGPILTTLVVVMSIVGVGLIAALLWWATGVWASLDTGRRWARVAGVAAVLATAGMVAEVGHMTSQWRLPINPPGTAFTARVGVERVTTARRTLAELADFRAAVTQDPFAGRIDLFGRIDRDVIVVFIESYGRTSFDTPFYAEMHRPTLAAAEETLASQGLAMRSGFLTAPTRGGQSWLSHATFSNGLWVDNQVSYGAMLSSGRHTLFHHAASNGFETAVVMPQITLDWPESARMGFETILVHDDLDYHGLPFNWVTMPDQFTLTAIDRLLRGPNRDRPLFALTALVSSHAPWTPVPHLLPWDEIGDGSEFIEMAQSGDPPEVVWRDRERVREQYRLAVDYSLQTVMGYAALHADDPPLLIVVGDHQAAAFIALDERAEVPIHIIGPDFLVDAIAEEFPQAGLIPSDGTVALPMQDMRDAFLSAYTVGVQARVAE